MKKVLSILILIAMLFTSVVPVSAAEQSSVSVPITIENAATTGKAKIERLGPGGQPTGESATVNIRNGSGSYAFVNTEPGDFEYKVSQIQGTNPDVIYDKSEYLVRVTVVYETNPNTGAYELVSYVYAIKTVDSEGNPIAIDPNNLDKCELKFANTEVEYKTVKRVITYTKYTPDGEKFFETVTQTVKLKRKKVPTSDGGHTYTGWEIVEGDQSAVESPTADGWKESRKVVPEWEIDLNDPQDAYENVYYTPITTEEYEYKTIKRIITYTRFTPDGEEVHETFTQTVTLRRKKTSTPDKPDSYGPWEIVEGDTSAVDAPNIPGWTPNVPQTPPWKIDLTNPQDAYENIYYTSKVVVDPTLEKKIKGNPKTGGRFTFVFEADNTSNPMPDGSIRGVRKLNVIGTGTFDFGEIVFTKPGVYTYKMYEEAGNEKGYTYDKTVVEVTFTIEVKDGQMVATRTDKVNGKSVEGAVFTNIYDPGSPDTGDLLNPMLWGGVLLAAVAGIVVVLIARRRKKDDVDQPEE